MTDNVDVKLFIICDESIESQHALPLVLGELIPPAGPTVFFIKTQVQMDLVL